MHSIGTWWLWLGFLLFILAVLAIDIILLNGKKTRAVSSRQALFWTFTWFTCAMLFAIGLGWYLKMTDAMLAQQKALEFLTGYVIEESLSVDNMFVFIMIFNYFVVPKALQRRVLLYGVLGAMVMRFIMIYLGVWVVRELHWILYLFGAFLIFSGIKMFLVEVDQQNLANNALLIWLRRHIRITDQFHGEKFFIKSNFLWYATPLFLALIFIEVSDVIFALDSIPAIFAITNDPFIIFTSNIFAILGLRALYFLLVNMAARFYLLKYAVALIIVFVGTKMLIEHWVQISTLFTLCVVVSVLAGTVILSFLMHKKDEA